MGELRTISLTVDAADGVAALEKLLVEKTMRIKKFMLHAFIAATASLLGYVQLSKQATLLETKDHGHLGWLEVATEIKNAAIHKKEDHIVIDMGTDYVEVEEDSYLYLYANTSGVGSITATAIIYYEE